MFYRNGLLSRGKRYLEGQTTSVETFHSNYTAVWIQFNNRQCK